MSPLLALAGNQNSGKTTLFNRLTGADQQTGNWPGVTVERKTGRLPAPDGDLELVDLPGVYSLTPDSADERVTRDFLAHGDADVIVNVLDAAQPERGLYLTLQLLALGRPMVLALNRMDEAARRGDRYDLPALERALGVSVAAISARTGAGVPELLGKARRAAQRREKPIVPSIPGARGRGGASSARDTTGVRDTTGIGAATGVSGAGLADAGENGAIWDAELGGRASDAGLCGATPAAGLGGAALDARLRGVVSHARLGSTALDARLGGADSSVPHKRGATLDAGLRGADSSVPHEGGADGDAPDARDAQARYAWIEATLRGCLRRGESRRAERSERLDRVLLHRIWALPLLALALLGVFHVAFGPAGAGVSAACGALVTRGAALLDAALARWGAAPWARGLLIDGVCRGVGGVLAFLPTLALLFFLLSLLEDSGYMARAAFLMDWPLRRLGLNGRAFIPLALGFGCTVPAVMSARALSSPRDRRLAILLTPMMSCGAKAPLYALLTGAFFPTRGAWVVGGLYALGVTMAALAGRLLRHTPLRGDAAPFLMELPDYRLPTLPGVLRRVGERVGDFVRRAFTVVFLASLALWFLRAVTPTLTPAETLESSLLGRLAGALAPLLRPAGFGDARAVAALLAGLLAKESVPATLSLLAGGAGLGAPGGVFSGPLAAASFLAFALLYSPCAAALAAIRRELGGARWAVGVALGQTLLAWLAAVLVYQGGRLLGLG